MFNSSNTLIRQFLTHTDRDGKSSGNVGLQDPTYLGFTVKFSFHNDEIRDGVGRWDPTQLSNGLLLPEDSLESAVHYLRNAGKPERAEFIKKFRSELMSIEQDKPWYFQSISGLNELLKTPEPGSNWSGKEKVLTFECLESVDMQLSFLSNLYRKGTFEKKWMRELLTGPKKQFSMTIIVSEIRNLHILDNEIKEVLRNINNGFKAPSTEGIKDIRGVEVAALRAEAGDNIYKPGEQSVDLWDLKNVTDYYDRFSSEYTKKTEEYEKGIRNAKETWNDFTFSDGDEDNKINGISASKSTNLSSAQNSAISSQVPGSQSTTPPGITKVAEPKNKEVVGSGNYLSEVKARLGDLVLKADNYITFYVFNLSKCEFEFDEHPWLDTVNNATADTAATMRFKIKVGDYEEVNQYGFKEWIVSDTDTNSASQENTVLNKFDDKKNNWAAWTSPKRDSLGEYSTDLERAASGDGKTAKERSVTYAKERDDSWTAKIRRFGKAGKEIADKYAPAALGVVKTISPELGKELSKLEDDIAKAKIGSENFLKKTFSQANDVLGELREINLSDPMSVWNAFKKLDESLKGAKGEPKGDSVQKAWTVYSNWLEMSKNKKTAEDFDLTGNTWRNAENGAYPNVGLESISSKKKTDLNWKNVSLKDSPSYDKKTEAAISPIQFSKPIVSENITPLNFQVPSISANISPLTLDKPSVSSEITPIEFDKPQTPGSITPLQFDKPTISESITPISFDKAPIVENITPITLDKAPIAENISPITLDKPLIATTITPLDFIKSPIATNITPIDFIKAPIVTNITPLEFTKAPIVTDITPIELVGAGFNGQITPKRLEFGLLKLDRKITPKNIYE